MCFSKEFNHFALEKLAMPLLNDFPEKYDIITFDKGHITRLTALQIKRVTRSLGIAS